ncbi:MAG: hypothetical protein MUP47_04850 [Phycisphaerae bacterium]|nr:hypothetical protein [Phycisphaerae bacterium]
MRRIWAVTRQTFAQCLRMKVAAAFILLLAVALAAMPALMKGDGTLAGKIRTLLNYGTTLTALLLSTVTIFVSAAVVASDVADKQVFLVATKPLPRWQYVLGRWLGVVMLDVLLLGCAGGAIYVFTQVLRTRPALNPDDRRAVEMEVFTARRRVSPAPPDVTAAVQERVARLKDEGRYSDALEAYKLRTPGDPDKAEQMLLNQVRAEEATAVQSVPLGGVFLWRFDDVRVTGQERTGQGTVTAISPQGDALRIEAGPRLLGGLVYQGPVREQGIDGRVSRLEDTFFEVLFSLEDARRSTIATLTPGRQVELIADPTIQVSFKVSAAQSPPENMLPGLWQVLNPSTGLFYQEFRRDKASQPHTLTLSARTVDSQGRTEIRYVNMPFDVSGAGTSVTILSSDVAVLYRLGGFEWNYLKALAMVLMQLMFLAAAGVFAGTFLSFPVACLVVFAALPLGMAMEFMTMATTVSPIEAHPAMKQIGAAALAIVKMLLPDLTQTNPSESLVGGMSIAWATLGRAAALTVGLRAAVVLGAACLVFSRRELARVQV